MPEGRGLQCQMRGHLSLHVTDLGGMGRGHWPREAPSVQCVWGSSVPWSHRRTTGHQALPAPVGPAAQMAHPVHGPWSKLQHLPCFRGSRTHFRDAPLICPFLEALLRPRVGGQKQVRVRAGRAAGQLIGVSPPVGLSGLCRWAGPWGFCNKPSQTRWLKTTEVCCLTGLEARGLKSSL